jgi:cytochrome c
MVAFVPQISVLKSENFMKLFSVVVFLVSTINPLTAADIGEELATRHCGVCHAVGATGANPNPLAPAFRDLSKKYPLDNLQEALAEGIMVGHDGPDMPEFVFEPKQIDALIDYMKRISKP